MSRSTLSSRLQAAMHRAQLIPARLAQLAETTDATISNWLKDNVQVDHVKAVQLFKIADAVKMDPRELLLGEDSAWPAGVAESRSAYGSHPVKPDLWKIAVQLVVEELEKREAALPPQKQAEAMFLAYDLLEEGMPRAKVLRFVLSAVA